MKAHHAWSKVMLYINLNSSQCSKIIQTVECLVGYITKKPYNIWSFNFQRLPKTTNTTGHIPTFSQFWGGNVLNWYGIGQILSTWRHCVVKRKSTTQECIQDDTTHPLVGQQSVCVGAWVRVCVCGREWRCVSVCGGMSEGVCGGVSEGVCVPEESKLAFSK